MHYLDRLLRPLAYVVSGLLLEPCLGFDEEILPIYLEDLSFMLLPTHCTQLVW